jgi:hypothetical protein
VSDVVEVSAVLNQGALRPLEFGMLLLMKNVPVLSGAMNSAAISVSLPPLPVHLEMTSALNSTLGKAAVVTSMIGDKK